MLRTQLQRVRQRLINHFQTRAVDPHELTMLVEPHIALAIGALVCFGISDLVYKRAAVAGVPTHQMMMVQSWSYGALVTIYGFATSTLVFDAASLWGIVAGVFAFTGFYNFARSFTAALAVIFLGEPLTGYKLAGLLFAPIAVWLLLGDRLVFAGVRLPSQSLARVLVATVAVAIANVLYKIGLREGATPAALLVVQAIAVITMSTTMVLAFDRRIAPSRTTVHHALSASVLLAFGFVFLMEGLARGDASVVVPIAQMGFIVTALLGVLLMREASSGRKATGIGVALLALASLAMS
jgi:drug/metabolite transporter (DMT)-like permease